MSIHSPQPSVSGRRLIIESPAAAEPQPGPEVPSVPAAASTPTHADRGDTGVVPAARESATSGTGNPGTWAIWSLVALALLPGIVARAAPELWAALPGMVRWAAYAASAVFTVAVAALIVKPVHARRP